MEETLAGSNLYPQFACLRCSALSRLLLLLLVVGLAFVKRERARETRERMNPCLVRLDATLVAMNFIRYPEYMYH